MNEKKPTMPGGLTRREFFGLREDLQQLLSDHPRAKFTVIFLDRDGHRTEDAAKFARYGLAVHEDETLLYEEFGDASALKGEKR